MKRELITIALSAMLAAGCATKPATTTTPVAEDSSNSLVGPRGADGPMGATGAQGETGARGAPGLAMAGERGPDGPTGATGATGAQGVSGEEGSKGRTTAGVAGSTGSTGATGAAGTAGSQGDKGVVSVVGQWTSYRDYNFGYDDAQVQDPDATQTATIAAYMKANPSLDLGLDGTMDPRGSDPKDQDMSERRVVAVRNALISAGIPAARIRIGAFGDPQTRRDRRVEVLFATSSSVSSL